MNEYNLVVVAKDKDDIKKYKLLIEHLRSLGFLDGLDIDLILQSQNARGYKCDSYLNLTGDNDIEFENCVLKPMIIKRNIIK